MQVRKFHRLTDLQQKFMEQIRQGSRKSRKLSPLSADSPRHFADGTDESVIVGYYTSAEVYPLWLAVYIQNEERSKILYGKK